MVPSSKECDKSLPDICKLFDIKGWKVEDYDFAHFFEDKIFFEIQPPLLPTVDRQQCSNGLLHSGSKWLNLPGIDSLPFLIKRVISRILSKH